LIANILLQARGDQQFLLVFRKVLPTLFGDCKKIWSPVGACRKKVNFGPWLCFVFSTLFLVFGNVVKHSLLFDTL